MKSMRVWLLTFIFIIAVSPFLLTCSHTGGTATVTINLGFPGHESAQNQSLIDRLLGLFLQKAYAQPPADIESFLVRVTGPGMGTIEYGFAPTVTSITVVVPAGEKRTISVIAAVSPSSPSAALAFTGTETLALNPGDIKSISVMMIVSETKIVIPDFYNDRIVQIDDISGSGWQTKNVSGFVNPPGLSIFTPYDIDFDARGRIYIANNFDSAGAHKLIRINDMVITEYNPIILDSQLAGHPLRTLAIDRINNVVYFASSTQLFRCDYDGNNLKTDFAMGGIADISGLAVDNDGMLYITYGNAPLAASYLQKYNPATESIIGTTSAVDYPWDVLVKDNFIYVTDLDGTEGYKILQFDMNLNLVGNFGVLSLVNPETPGNFYGPRRFVAILNRKITMIDDNSGDDYDKLVSMSDINGSNWEYFGSSGSGVGQFSFYYFSGC